VQLDIESKVMAMFGEQLRASVPETIESYELEYLTMESIFTVRLTVGSQRHIKYARREPRPEA
jgi:citrate lyase gamma subunit